MTIKELKAREILDSRGIPTIETYIEFVDGTSAIAGVPSGSSTGATEVLELRDGDPNRYFGKGCLTAVGKVNQEIRSAIIGKSFNSQADFDHFLIELDGTEFKSKLGGNSILSVSMAYCKASARSQGKELYDYLATIFWGESYDQSLIGLPQPMILIMEGGAHGNWSTDFQEYMIVPKFEKFPLFSEALRAGAEIFKATHDILVDKNYSATVGLEGAFSPIQIKSNTEAFDIIIQGIEKAGYRPQEDIVIALDIASSEFYDSQKQEYNLHREGKRLKTKEWIDLQKQWINKYPIWSIEDGLDQEDWDGWIQLNAELGSNHQIVGDDLLTTNVKRLQKSIDLKASNSILIKVNQIGTVTETIDAIKLADENNYTSVISHRGGETNDSFIADLVVATSSWQSKFGGPDRGERLAKYNRLLEIEEKLFS